MVYAGKIERAAAAFYVGFCDTECVGRTILEDQVEDVQPEWSILNRDMSECPHDFATGRSA